MSEPAKKTVAVPPALPGAKATAGNPAPVAATESPAKPVSPSAPVAVAQPVKPALFGGHKGGGKKRTDGLVAGSPAAIEADRKKDAERMRRYRAEKKSSEIPATLPSMAATASNPADALAAAEPALALPAAGVAAVPGVVAMPLFVAWSEKTLARICGTLMKIVERVRCSSLMVRIRKMSLTPVQEKEIERDIQFKAAAVLDFNNALANCATVELNKHRVPGAEHSHWVDVAITGGELVHHHLDVVEKLEKMIVENELKRRAENAEAINVTQN